MDIFVGGGGDDLNALGLGVVRHAAVRHAARTGRVVLYMPNARLRRLGREVRASAALGARVNLVGHSWGAVDAYAAAAAALNRGLPIANLITLDPVSGPWRRPRPWPGGAFWLNVTLHPRTWDYTDRLTRLWPLARKPSRLPLEAADRNVVLGLHHWDVEGMLDRSGAAPATRKLNTRFRR